MARIDGGEDVSMKDIRKAIKAAKAGSSEPEVQRAVPLRVAEPRRRDAIDVDCLGWSSVEQAVSGDIDPSERRLPENLEKIINEVQSVLAHADVLRLAEGLTSKFLPAIISQLRAPGRIVQVLRE